jgi:hypothetical protein
MLDQSLNGALYNPWLAGIPVSDTVSITTKANLQSDPGRPAQRLRDWAGSMRGRWSLAIAGLIPILAGGLLAHFTQTGGGIKIQDVRFAGAKGNTVSALLYIPANATAADRTRQTLWRYRTGHRDVLHAGDHPSGRAALKLMSGKQFLIFLIYLVPFTAFFVIALQMLHRNFSTMAAPRGALYLTNIFALTLGFIVLLVLQYGTLWLTGKLFNPLPDPASCRSPPSSPSSSCRSWRSRPSSRPSPGGGPAQACRAR